MDPQQQLLLYIPQVAQVNIVQGMIGTSSYRVYLYGFTNIAATTHDDDTGTRAAGQFRAENRLLFEEVLKSRIEDRGSKIEDTAVRYFEVNLQSLRFLLRFQVRPPSSSLFLFSF